MENKFNMALEQNIFLAKRNIVDYIYKSANLEGIHITFPETQALFDGIGVNGIKVDDIIKINNLKRAWSFLLDTLDRLTDFDYLFRINKIIESGSRIYLVENIRRFDISIPGTKWHPQIPVEYDIRNEMADILNIENTTDRAITLMLWSMRSQVFIGGNKRTAMMIANKEMISGGSGIISIPTEKIKSFYELLIEFYETNDMHKIKSFIYDNCIDGMEIEEQRFHEEMWKEVKEENKRLYEEMINRKKESISESEKEDIFW